MAISKLLAGLLICAGLMACSQDKPESENNANEDLVLQEFKTQPLFTLLCNGEYALTSNGETSTGTQSFGISFDPNKLVSFYFNFEAEGSYNSGQSNMNNEVLRISKVDTDWIYVGAYRFNRRTLKYGYYGSLAMGVCKFTDNIDIPDRKI